jgi:branched-subunit amino acid permease
MNCGILNSYGFIITALGVPVSGILKVKKFGKKWNVIYRNLRLGLKIKLLHITRGCLTDDE